MKRAKRKQTPERIENGFGANGEAIRTAIERIESKPLAAKRIPVGTSILNDDHFVMKIYAKMMLGIASTAYAN